MTDLMFPREKVWAAAAAAQRMNGEYIKRGASSKLLWENYHGPASKPIVL